MSKSIHEQATEVIAKVIDLERTEALNKINRECEGNEELKKAVLLLFEDIFSDTSQSQQKHMQLESDKSKKIARKEHDSTLVLQRWSSYLFENKRVRLIILSVFLFLLLAIGVSVRFQVRHMLIDDAGIYLDDQLASQQLRLEEWIEKGKETVQLMASDQVIVEVAKKCDSLQMVDPSLELLNDKSLIRSLSQQFRMSQSFTKVPTGIISKEGARILCGLYGARIEEEPVVGERLGKGIYDAYLDAMDGVVFVKPLSSEETIYKYSDTTNSQVVCVFFAPVHDADSNLLGIIFNTYLARNEFSEILTLVHVGHRGETYAFDKKGRMLSSGRFLKQLKEIPYFELAPDDETIYNIILKNPGVDVSNGAKPKFSKTQLPYVEPLQDLLVHLDQGTPSEVIRSDNDKPYRNYRGKKVISRWFWWSDYNFGIITEIRLKNALSTLRFFDYAFVVLYILIFTLSYWLFTSNIKIFRFGKKLSDYKRLGQYKLGKKLGEGGFGEVFKAEHAFLKTPVAVKLLKKQFNGTDMLDRFEKEVKVTASLSNPNTIKVFDYGTTNEGQFYYVMEFLNGVPLDQLISIDKKVSVARGIHILLGVCYSLQEAHGKGLIHRDIKPMNVMVCNQGGARDVVKVLDFGLVKNIDSTIAEQTQINRIGGTPMFMAPERLRDPFNTDQKVDIYSVGALGIYMFSGKYILELISQQMLSGEKTIQGNLKEGLFEGVELPSDLRELLFSCLNFDPAMRPQNIDELINVLEALQKDFEWSNKQAADWWKSYDVYN